MPPAAARPAPWRMHLLALLAAAGLATGCGSQDTRPPVPATPSQPAAAAAPLSEATLHTLLATEQVPERMRQAMDAMARAQEEAIARIPDAAERSRQRAAHAAARPTLERHFEWTRLQPMVSEVYRAHYTEADAQALLAFYATAPGQLHLHQLQPATIQAAIALMQFMDQRVDAILETSDDQGQPTQPPRGSAPPPPRPPAWQAGTEQDALAGELAQLLMRPAFEDRMQRLEAAMREQLSLLLPGAPSERQQQWLQQISQRIRAEVRFETVLPLIVQPLRARLSTDDLRVLLGSERQPARQAQRAKVAAASAALSARINAWTRDEVFPALLGAMAQADRAPPASTPASPPRQ